VCTVYEYYLSRRRKSQGGSHHKEKGGTGISLRIQRKISCDYSKGSRYPVISRCKYSPSNIGRTTQKHFILSDTSGGSDGNAQSILGCQHVDVVDVYEIPFRNCTNGLFSN
jgi:hypothetical protein